MFGCNITPHVEREKGEQLQQVHADGDKTLSSLDTTSNIYGSIKKKHSRIELKLVFFFVFFYSGGGGGSMLPVAPKLLRAAC